jgi:hypothetical protein
VPLSVRARASRTAQKAVDQFDCVFEMNAFAALKTFSKNAD